MMKIQSSSIPIEVRDHARLLWDFLVAAENTPSPSDFLLVAGSHDTRVAEHATKLYLVGMAGLIIVSGGFGKVTNSLWKKTEAERFAEIMYDQGVPMTAILLENTASNTGDNFIKSKALVETSGISLGTGIIVTKPYMCRRAIATGAKQWPEIRWTVSAPNISFDDYPNSEVPIERMINLMVGDFQRISIYPKKGFQIAQTIPDSLWDSFFFLARAGYDDFIIRDESGDVAV